ncbi:NifS-like protein (selenocysteine lyase) [Candidatus Phytoplasma mali]|uniref:cysteine desulfurase n=1 Tax=Phytoplasma mali (strain AT) TaxID=482235 RepID=B3R0D6_PHYMT|nr:aminotransferase class V-fold PLP-dependent enzyme [Candidatus Phytoplasma mali]CAP18300.1 NifS-like protein (selenocysteine lyase) [Candidatus Phytoplasma mali]
MIKSDFKYLFPIFNNNPNLVYFDHASTSLKPKKMIIALENFYCNNGVSTKSFYDLSEHNTLLVEKTRKKTAYFINSCSEEIIFTKSTTESLNMLAFGLSHLLKEGDEIIISELEHNASFLPWLRISKQTKAKLVFIPLNDNNQINFYNFKKVFNKKTKIVILTHISNVLGYKPPIKEITNLAHSSNALVILDSAQYVSHFRLDVRDLDVDFVCFSAHKMYGPFGLGILFVKNNLLYLLKPLLLGGGIIELFDSNDFSYKFNVNKFEAGTYNISSIISFKEVLEFINDIGFEKIIDHERKIYQYAIEQLKKFSNIIIYNPDSYNIITFNLTNINAHDVVTFLAKENICVRVGKLCADLILKKIKQTSVIRISIGIHNNKNDVVLLINALKKIINFFKRFKNDEIL